MSASTEVQFRFVSHTEEAGSEFLPEVQAWLAAQPGLSGAPVIQASSAGGVEVVSLAVTLDSARALVPLASAVSAWLNERHGDITVTLSASGTTVELRSGVDPAKIYLVLRPLITTVEALSESLKASGANFGFSLTGEGFDVSSRPGADELHNIELPALAGFGDRHGQEPEDAYALTIPVTIYLSNESIHQQVETAIEALLAVAGLHIESRDDPIVGSWFRRMVAGIKEVARSPAAHEATLVAAHVADTRLVLAQDAAVTATLLQNLGPVLGALQPTKDAVIRAGALLIVKVDWVVNVFQLTAAQQAVLDHRPQIAHSPHEIIATLNLMPEDRQGEGPSAALL